MLAPAESVAAQGLRSTALPALVLSAIYDFRALVSRLLLFRAMAEFHPSRTGVNMKSTLSVGILMLAAAASCGAQGMRAGQNGAKPNQPAAALDPAAIQTISGTVTAVNIAYGAQYPSIVVNGTTIKAAPIWFLLENNFEIKTGDSVTVKAAPCNQPAETGLYALEIINDTTQASIKLRDESGLPLWGGMRGRRGGGPGMMRMGAGAMAMGAGPARAAAAGARGGCIDPAGVKTVTGIVEQVNAGAGIQMPALTLKTADGQTITMKIGPERILLANDFELKPGDQVTAKYAPAACTNEFVALELTNAAGNTVVLRTL
jgi:hypothetical protein